jgi:DUF4097 and DUF4098 domain-containing protein YvlB
MRRMLVVSVALFGSLLYGQDSVRIPFSGTGRQRLVKLSTVSGSIHVRGYDGKEVIIDTKGGGRRPDRQVDGLRRIDMSPGFTAEEQDNVVTIKADPPHAPSSIDLQVPTDTSLQLSTVNGGEITVEGVEGELDVKNTNGSVKLTRVGGAVVANTSNGAVTAVLDRVTPGRPMSFSSLNGNVDVTLPADVKANVKLRSDNGDVYTDFDIQLGSSGQGTSGRGSNGKYRVNIDKTISGTINGGGPEMRLTTLNGRIMLRKAK